jgi:HK97 family phage portal protein
VSIIRRIIGAQDERAIGRISGYIPFDRIPPLGENAIDAAMNLTAYQAGIRLLADTVSALPADSFIRRDGERKAYRPKPIWLTKPDPRNETQTFQSLVSQMVISLYTNGNCFLATMRSSDGEVQELRVLPPEKVDIERNADGSPRYLYRKANGNVEVFTQDQIKHIPLLRMPGEERGVDLLTANKQAILQGVAVEEYTSAFFQNASNPSGVVSLPPNIKKEDAEAIRDQIKKNTSRSNQWSVAVMSGGASWQSLGGINAEQAQLLSTRNFTVLQVCRILRVPPFMLGITDPGAMSYNSVEAQSMGFIRDTLRPLCTILESALSQLIIAPDAFVKFNMEAMLRGVSADRAAFYSSMASSGFISTNEVRKLEELTPIEGGDFYRTSLADAPSIVVAELNSKANLLKVLIDAGIELEEARKLVGI